MSTLNKKVAADVISMLGEKHFFSDERFSRVKPGSTEYAILMAYKHTANLVRDYPLLSFYTAPVAEVVAEERQRRALERIRETVPANMQNGINLYGTPCSEAGFEHEKVVLAAFVPTDFRYKRFSIAFYGCVMHVPATGGAAGLLANSAASNGYVNTSLYSNLNCWTDLIDNIDSVFDMLAQAAEREGDLVQMLDKNFDERVFNISLYFGHTMWSRISLPSFFPKEIFEETDLPF